MKLYVPEFGHEVVRATAIENLFVVASLARVEVPAAFWGKFRTGELSAADSGLLVRAFEFDYHGNDQAESSFAVLAVDDSIIVAAAGHAAGHGLRAYDAVQLACAIASRRTDPSVDTFAVYDRQLRDAALTEGFLILGPD